MYRRTARFYDAMYTWKDYPNEAEQLRALVARYRRSDGNELLDMACGTGMHLKYLKAAFAAQGADANRDMLAIARERNPDLEFVEASFLDFDLGRTFDVITCMFSSIGYAGNLAGLRSACRAFARHLVPGGIVCLEPWLTPDTYRTGQVHLLVVDEEDLKITRMNVSRREGRTSILDMHHLIGTPEGVEHVVDHHEMFLATEEEFRGALEEAGLEVFHEHEGFTNRGIFIGR